MFLRRRSVALALVSLLAAACRRGAHPPAPTFAAQDPATRADVRPTAQQLVRNYHGKVERRDGAKNKLFLQITSAVDTPEGIQFKYTLNSPDYRTDDTLSKPGMLSKSGHVTFATFSGRARVVDGDVVLESAGIEGPPYWHFVGRRGSLPR